MRGRENHAFRLGADENRRMVFFAVDSTDADITAEIGADAKLRLLLLFVGAANDSVRARIHVRHRGANSASEVIVRGVLYDTGSAAIEGSLFVEAKTRGVSARFEGKALLEGSGSAEILPMLEVLTPNVHSVRHAASVSRLSPEERLYLESRGLDASESVQIAAEGFLKAPFSCAIEIPEEYEIFKKKLKKASVKEASINR